MRGTTFNLSLILLSVLVLLASSQTIEYAVSTRSYGGSSKSDNYFLAGNMYSAQRTFGDAYSKCRTIEYISFRLGNNYLTANANGLTLQYASSPANNQLFIGQQQIDGSWGFRSLTENRYVRASEDGSTVNWSQGLFQWERWFMERKGNLVYIQSANFQHQYWITSNGVLRQMKSGACGFSVEHIPKLNWLWNW